MKVGKGTFFRDLRNSEELIDFYKKNGYTELNLELIKTDLDESVFPDKSISPEELFQHFKDEKFHLIVSTYGGVNYSTINKKKAIANIIGVLEKGGIVSIVLLTRVLIFPSKKHNDFVWSKDKSDPFKKMLKQFGNVSCKIEHEHTDCSGVLFVNTRVTSKKL